MEKSFFRGMCAPQYKAQRYRICIFLFVFCIALILYFVPNPAFLLQKRSFRYFTGEELVEESKQMGYRLLSKPHFGGPYFRKGSGSIIAPRTKFSIKIKENGAIHIFDDKSFSDFQLRVVPVSNDEGKIGIFYFFFDPLNQIEMTDDLVLIENCF